MLCMKTCEVGGFGISSSGRVVQSSPQVLRRVGSIGFVICTSVTRLQNCSTSVGIRHLVQSVVSLDLSTHSVLGESTVTVVALLPGSIIISQADVGIQACGEIRFLRLFCCRMFDLS